MKHSIQPTQTEKPLSDDAFIVSKTDLKGRITYGNRTFQEFTGYDEKELLGAPQSIIRHPDMPRGIFKLVWDALGKEREVFAYVKNLTADGSFYWVFANMTPSFDKAGKVIGYFSVRRAPRREAVKIMEEIYRRMLAEEAKVSKPAQPDASLKLLSQMLAEKEVSYDDFILSI
jgi:PAS domain S-box-containing protein